MRICRIFKGNKLCGEMISKTGGYLITKNNIIIFGNNTSEKAIASIKFLIKVRKHKLYPTLPLKLIIDVYQATSDKLLAKALYKDSGVRKVQILKYQDVHKLLKDYTIPLNSRHQKR